MFYYYEDKAQEYIDKTKDVNVDVIYSKVFEYIKHFNTLLDVGCGQGRDLRYFRNKGIRGEGIEPSKALCDYSRKHSGRTVHNCTLKDYKCDTKYDVIIANASLVHMNDKELIESLDKIHLLLKETGIVFISLKYGSGTLFRNYLEYYKRDMSTINKVINWKWTKEKMWITQGNNDEWLNIILKKRLDCDIK